LQQPETRPPWRCLSWSNNSCALDSFFTILYKLLITHPDFASPEQDSNSSRTSRNLCTIMSCFADATADAAKIRKTIVDISKWESSNLFSSLRDWLPLVVPSEFLAQHSVKRLQCSNLTCREQFRTASEVITVTNQYVPNHNSPLFIGLYCTCRFRLFAFVI
jgi:hypothetical protein